MPLAVAREEPISVEDYLAAERVSEIRHEYVGGVVYAMAGASKDHVQIALNIYSFFRGALRGGPCRAFVTDLKVQLKWKGEDVFYYPDVVIGCDRRDTRPELLTYPKLVVEVLSDSTQRLDRWEKRLAYQGIETLQEYLLVAQDRLEATLFRRANNWDPEVFAQLKQKVPLESLGLKLSLTAIYEGVLA
ncbi:MAG: hypothetical protein C5B50_12870 [Verrucomicrobia bacterium]|nr:MAG: hypothetical protein C5B50_12870 [Verrucomicrobiota bacterium]